MPNFSQIFLRVKLSVASNLRQNKKIYLFSAISFAIGVVLAIIFAITGPIVDVVGPALIDEILRGQGVLYSFWVFLPYYLIPILLICCFSFLQRLRWLNMLVILICARKLHVWGIGLILTKGLTGILDYLIFFWAFYTTFLFSLVFISNIIVETNGCALKCRRCKAQNKEIFREVAVLCLISILIQLLVHVFICFLIKTLF
jgi:hypothetical protein